MLPELSNRSLYKYWKRFRTIPATSYVIEHFKKHSINDFIDYAYRMIEEKVKSEKTSHWINSVRKISDKCFGSDCLECSLKDSLLRFCSLILVLSRYRKDYITLNDIVLNEDDLKLYSNPLDNDNTLFDYTKDPMPCNDQTIHYAYLLECLDLYKKEIKTLMKTSELITMKDIEKIERRYINLRSLDICEMKNDEVERFIDELRRLE